MKWLFAGLVALSLAACGPVIVEDENPNPTLRGDYSSKYENLKQALQGSLRQQQTWISENEYVYLVEKVEAARDHLPVSGLALGKTFDDQGDFGLSFVLPAQQPVVMVRRIQSWQICPMSFNLGAIDLRIGNSEFSLFPNPGTAYVGIVDQFNYGANRPQYDLSPDAVVLRHQASSTISPFRSQGCRKSRQIVEYSVFSEATLEAITKWKSALNEIIGDLDRLRASRSGGTGTPPSDLRTVINKLNAAYSSLP